ncbi:hypothetical protein LNQ52_31010 [Klebsiella pneumoniae subsp. pneumoniae]|nr:hypothetical protein [Klebsiella pneumoniae subsp. pneumoniae]
MSETVIALNGLSRRFPGMDRPAVAPAHLHDPRRLRHRAGGARRRGENHPDANARRIAQA